MFTVAPIPQSSMRSWRVLVLFSANDMPMRLASAFRAAHVVRARDSTDFREPAERQMNASSTYEITSRVELGEVSRRVHQGFSISSE